MSDSIYTVRFSESLSELKGFWDGCIWEKAEIGEILHLRPEGSGHFPRTRFKLLYSDSGISGIFLVNDRYVKCSHRGFSVPVYKDSCVEFFVKPASKKGYFNFEFNCGGSILCSYITDHKRTPDGFKESVPLSQEDLQLVRIFHSLPEIIDEEIKESVEWVLEFFIPFSLIEKYCGFLGALPGNVWMANFQKCGDETSHPHWISWKPLPELNFHLPECFGELKFEEKAP